MPLQAYETRWKRTWFHLNSGEFPLKLSTKWDVQSQTCRKISGKIKCFLLALSPAGPCRQRVIYSISLYVVVRSFMLIVLFPWTELFSVFIPTSRQDLISYLASVSFPWSIKHWNIFCGVIITTKKRQFPARYQSLKSSIPFRKAFSEATARGSYGSSVWAHTAPDLPC